MSKFLHDNNDEDSNADHTKAITISNMELSKRVEKTLGKGEIAYNEQFIPKFLYCTVDNSRNKGVTSWLAFYG